MKVEIFLAILLSRLSTGERQQRSTVLTDESKRILEQFDFSNFDKQEALNYLDRQRYENQIRGKRSHFKPVHTNIGYNTENIEVQQIQKALKPQNNFIQYYGEKPNLFYIRKKRGHRFKKKHKSKLCESQDCLSDEEYGEEPNCNYRIKKKKKRHYWDRWTEWSPCSVTCGRGRKIRWRKCIAKSCSTGDLEMGEKTCQLPACNLITKLLGL